MKEFVVFFRTDGSTWVTTVIHMAGVESAGYDRPCMVPATVGCLLKIGYLAPSRSWRISEGWPISRERRPRHFGRLCRIQKK